MLQDSATDITNDTTVYLHILNSKVLSCSVIIIQYVYLKNA